MSTLEVSDIPETWLQRLDARAREQGRDRSQIVREILARELDIEDTSVLAHGFDATLTSIRQGFTESGESENELTAILDEGLRVTRSARRQSNPALKSGVLASKNGKMNLPRTTQKLLRQSWPDYAPYRQHNCEPCSNAARKVSKKPT